MEKYYVYIYLDGAYQRCALLSYDGELYRFAYGIKYLQRKDAVALDPINLPLYDKTFESEYIFGVIKDSAPDRWGRYLLDKNFNRKLSELEYILANGLEHVGALAFSPENFNTPVRLMPTGYVPHGNDSIGLEVIIEQTELILKNEADEEKLKALLLYGPSLGGARPKYSIKIGQDFYLAKYGISQDSRREQLIEFASMSMARALGFNVPEIKIGKAFDRDVFYIKRFDRDKGKKFPFVSALSICEWDENGHQDWSYPVFCEALIKIGKNQKSIVQDLKELFRRIAFNIAINNNDDHPRNHGVLWQNGTWGLSPLYDVVPMDSNTQTFSLAMEVGLKKKEASKSNLLSVSKYFRLEEDEASNLVDEIFDFVAKNWKGHFKKVGLTETEIKRFENAMRPKP